MISIIILTKNEEIDLPACLESVRWSDDVHVLDSGSTDNTIKIAKHFNAKILTNLFESFGKQRNFALDNIKLKYNWILFLDADEVVTEKFKVEVYKAIINADEDVAGFYCCWKMILEGKWLKNCDNFPKWQFRLMYKGKARFIDSGHGQKEGQVVGRIEYIKEPYLHYGFSKGWYNWFERHNKYSSQEAISRSKDCPPFINLFSRNRSMRNVALKSWLSKLPGWPVLRFIHAYIFNLGFFEGTQGFIYCMNMAYYEFLIQIKMREIESNKVFKD